MKVTGRYIKDVIYGANDGIVTAFAIVAGVAGAGLEPIVVVLLGVANVFADAFSMASSSYLGSKSERDFIADEYQKTLTMIERDPEHAEQHIVMLLEHRGYKNGEARELAVLFQKNKRFMTDFFLHEDLQISAHKGKSIHGGALTTFISFVIAGVIPILPFLFLPASSGRVFQISIFATMITLFVVGAFRSLVTRRSFLFSGFEMLFIGGVAAAIAYGVGFLLSGVFSWTAIHL